MPIFAVPGRQRRDLLVQVAGAVGIGDAGDDAARGLPVEHLAEKVTWMFGIAPLIGLREIRRCHVDGAPRRIGQPAGDLGEVFLARRRPHAFGAEQQQANGSDVVLRALDPFAALRHFDVVADGVAERRAIAGGGRESAHERAIEVVARLAVLIGGRDVEKRQAEVDADGLIRVRRAHRRGRVGRIGQRNVEEIVELADERRPLRVAQCGIEPVVLKDVLSRVLAGIVSSELTSRPLQEPGLERAPRQVGILAIAGELKHQGRPEPGVGVAALALGVVLDELVVLAAERAWRRRARLEVGAHARPGGLPLRRPDQPRLATGRRPKTALRGHRAHCDRCDAHREEDQPATEPSPGAAREPISRCGSCRG